MKLEGLKYAVPLAVALTLPSGCLKTGASVDLVATQLETAKDFKLSETNGTSSLRWIGTVPYDGTFVRTDVGFNMQAEDMEALLEQASGEVDLRKLNIDQQASVSLGLANKGVANKGWAVVAHKFKQEATFPENVHVEDYIREAESKSGSLAFKQSLWCSGEELKRLDITLQDGEATIMYHNEIYSFSMPNDLSLQPVALPFLASMMKDRPNTEILNAACKEIQVSFVEARETRRDDLTMLN